MGRSRHRLVGRIIALKVAKPDPLRLDGKKFKVVDWFENIAGKSWKEMENCSPCKSYEIRLANSNLPNDDDVVLGFEFMKPIIVHDSEIIYPDDCPRMKRMEITWEDEENDGE